MHGYCTVIEVRQTGVGEGTLVLQLDKVYTLGAMKYPEPGDQLDFFLQPVWFEDEEDVDGR